MQGLLFYFFEYHPASDWCFCKTDICIQWFVFSKKHSANVRWYCFFSCKAEFDLYMSFSIVFSWRFDQRSFWLKSFHIWLIKILVVRRFVKIMHFVLTGQLFLILNINFNFCYYNDINRHDLNPKKRKNRSRFRHLIFEIVTYWFSVYFLKNRKNFD